MLRYIALIFSCLFLSACHSLPPVGQLPELKQVTMFQVTEREDEQSALQSLLIIEPQSADTWRWIQLDALGAPISRQVVQEGKWRNDGFLPPNAQARALFIAVYVYLSKELGETEDIPLETMSALQVEDSAEGVLLSFQNKQWLVKELQNE